MSHELTTARRSGVSLVALACVVLAGCGLELKASPRGTPAPAPSSIATPDASESPQAIIERAIRHPAGAAISACEVVDGATAWSGLAGSIDGVPVTSSTRWRTGSIGKTVTAAEVLRLVERGDLDLDEPAAPLVPPGLDTNGSTIRDLLRMRSGLDSDSPAGTTFAYRNGDYELLGHVIEGVEHRRLGDVLTADILKVAGADGLTFPAKGNVTNAAGPLDTDCPSLARWGEALFGGRLLQPGSLSLMTRFTQGGYGMGVFDFSSDFGRRAYGHLGQDGRWAAGLVFFPDHVTTLVVLMNVPDPERPYRVLRDLALALEP